MKKAIIVVWIFSVISIQCWAEKLPNGKPVSVRLTNSVKSNVKNKQIVTAIVDRDVVDTHSGAVLIGRGTPVTMGVNIRKAKGVGKPGEIQLQCISVKSVDNQDISLQGSYQVVGDDRKGLAIGLGVGLGLFCWPALFCLCIKGEKQELPADLLLPNVVVNDTYNIKVK